MKARELAWYLWTINLTVTVFRVSISECLSIFCVQTFSNLKWFILQSKLYKIVQTRKQNKLMSMIRVHL